MADNIIKKSILLNWLKATEEDISLDELGKLIEARTNGKYRLIKQEPKKILADE